MPSQGIEKAIRVEIQSRLQAIEAEERICIPYACESGSRAWGFPSVDSDYDVRFIYLRPREWYLSIDVERRRDVIEHTGDDKLDISGWDLRKALQLLRKGSPPLMEWLGSPIVYVERFTVADRMRDLLIRYHSPAACLYHYLHMAQGNYREYLKEATVWVKKYFYVLRPILVIKWIEKGLGVVPTEFQVLVDNLVESPKLKEEIDRLIEAKRQGEELDRGPRIAAISGFIERELVRLGGKRFEQHYSAPKAPTTEFNRVFRAALDEVWEESA
jgi:predicted nucleotidyltransferase